ncbi:hypothetical protein GCM10009654_15510 [Streptomyces hebeiensis]|uniref:Uncharacterized protein n=1 Tax=Streptomyces hebeiensis TaxID=229486 RepID=A0ABN1UNU1_9ACTN
MSLRISGQTVEIVEPGDDRLRDQPGPSQAPGVRDAVSGVLRLVRVWPPRMGQMGERDRSVVNGITQVTPFTTLPVTTYVSAMRDVSAPARRPRRSQRPRSRAKMLMRLRGLPRSGP